MGLRPKKVVPTPGTTFLQHQIQTPSCKTGIDLGILATVERSEGSYKKWLRSDRDSGSERSHFLFWPLGSAREAARRAAKTAVHALGVRGEREGGILIPLDL